MDEKTLNEQSIWTYYKQIEAENYHLKKQLSHKNKEIKNLKRSIGYFKSLHKKAMENKKPKYRNNGKGGK